MIVGAVVLARAAKKAYDTKGSGSSLLSEEESKSGTEIKTIMAELESLKKRNEALSRANAALQIRHDEMERDALRIGVLYVAPLIHVRVLSEFIREMDSPHKKRIFARYSSDPSMESSGQVFNILFGFLIICLKASQGISGMKLLNDDGDIGDDDTSAPFASTAIPTGSRPSEQTPKREELKVRLSPYVRYICVNFLDNGTRLMTEEECTNDFHSWLLSCCEGVIDLSTAEQEMLENEIARLRKQLERAKRDKKHLRKESMLQVSMLRNELDDMFADAGDATGTGGTAGEDGSGGGSKTSGKKFGDDDFLTIGDPELYSDSVDIDSDDKDAVIRKLALEKIQLVHSASQAIEQLRSQIAAVSLAAGVKR